MKLNFTFMYFLINKLYFVCGRKFAKYYVELHVAWNLLDVWQVSYPLHGIQAIVKKQKIEYWTWRCCFPYKCSRLLCNEVKSWSQIRQYSSSLSSSWFRKQLVYLCYTHCRFLCKMFCMSVKLYCTSEGIFLIFLLITKKPEVH